MGTKSENCVFLNNGNLMPLLGLGCWQSPANEVETAVEIALDNGYRHIDTAYNYQNEEAVGNGIRNWLKKSETHKKEDIFVVTKLPGIGMFKGGVKKFMQLSLKKLGLSYVDLYLVHIPTGFKYYSDDKIFPMTEHGNIDIDAGTDLIAVWKEMEQMVKEGLAKSIGISNFNIRQMRKILAVAKIPPAVNQVEMHLNFQQKELIEFCNKSKIMVTAYAPLGSPGRDYLKPSSKDDKCGPPPPLENLVVKLVAENHDVTTAQILIKFLIQQGIVTIPKSVNPERIRSNGKVFHFTLSEMEMEALRLMDQGEAGRTFELSKYPGLCDHPECPF